jgi:hypothetical protein
VGDARATRRGARARAGASETTQAQAVEATEEARRGRPVTEASRCGPAQRPHADQTDAGTREVARESPNRQKTGRENDKGRSRAARPTTELKVPRSHRSEVDADARPEGDQSRYDIGWRQTIVTGG